MCRDKSLDRRFHPSINLMKASHTQPIKSGSKHDGMANFYRSAIFEARKISTSSCQWKHFLTHLALNLSKENFPIYNFPSYAVRCAPSTKFTPGFAMEKVFLSTFFSWDDSSWKSQINPIYFTCQFLGKQLHYMTDFIIGNEKAKKEGDFIGS